MFGPQRLGGIFVDSEIHPGEGAGHDDAVITTGTFNGDVLIPHILEHPGRVALERVAPTASPAEVIDELVAGRQQVPLNRRGHHDLAFRAGAHGADIRAAVEAPGDSRVDVALVDDILVDVGRCPHFLDEVAAAAAAEFPGPPRIGDQVAASEYVREEALVEFGFGLDQVPHRRHHRSPSVESIDGVDPAGAHLASVVEEGLPGSRVPVAVHLARAAEFVGLRGAPLGDDLAHGKGNRIPHLDPGVMRATAHRFADPRVEAAAFRDSQLYTVEETLVLGYRRIDQAGQLGNGIPPSVAERGPGADVGPVVGTGEVDDEPFARNGDRHMDVDVQVALRVGVDEHVGFIGSVRPLADLLREATVGVVDRVIDGRHDGGRAVAFNQLTEPPNSELGCTDLRAEIPDEAGHPVVGPHGQDHVSPFDSTVDDLEERITGPFTPDVLRSGVVPTCRRAASVAVVTLDRRDQQQLAVGREDRREDVEVREMAAAMVGVVGDDDIAGPQLLAEELRARTAPATCC